MRTTPTQQSVALLALVAGSLLTVKDNGLLPEIKDAVEAGAKSILDIIAEYRHISDPEEDVLATSVILSKAAAVINRSSDWFSVEVVVRLGFQICTDLLGEVCQPQKRALITQAMGCLRGLDDFLDPEGGNEEVTIEVEEILKAVYKEVGFETNLRYLKHFRKLQRRQKRHAGIKL
jgi:hypothetical protein